MCYRFSEELGMKSSLGVLLAAGAALMIAPFANAHFIALAVNSRAELPPDPEVTTSVHGPAAHQC